ncbi:MAG: response regulator [Bacteroidota bacterium]
MTSIFIVDDHHVVHDGIESLLRNQPDLSVIGYASTGKEALERIQSLQPDIVFMDIMMPSMNGIEVTQRLFKNGFKGKVIILTQYEKEEYVREAFEAGASGYLLKESLQSETVIALRAVADGKTYWSPSISSHLTLEWVRKAASQNENGTKNSLTKREKELLDLLLAGYTMDRIASELSMHPKTVEFHVANIKQKLGNKEITEITNQKPFRN